MSLPLAAAREQFIEQVGMIAQAEGWPRISGRVMGLLVFDGVQYSFSQIAEELQVSRGSISSSVRKLTEMGVIERVAKPGDRQDYFQLGEDPYTTILKSAMERAEKARSSIHKSIQAVPEENSDIRNRLEQYKSFYGTLIDTLADANDPKVERRDVG